MAFLMLLHEKLRLQRKVNKLQLRLAQTSSRKERVTKQIERIQKMYAKREANLDTQAKRMENYANLQFKNVFGLASNMINTNPMGYINGGLNNGGIIQTLMQGIASGQVSLEQKDKDGNATGISLSQEELMNMLSGNGYCKVQKDGNTYICEGTTPPEDTSSWTPDEDLQKKFAFAQQLQNAASCQYQMNQNYCTNAITNYQTNISIWLDYEKAQLDAEQDDALLPLQEQETEWDLEKETIQAQLDDAKARLDGMKQALSEGIKDSAPTFGLG